MNHDMTYSFGERNFEHINVGDQRRRTRLIALTDQIVRHPGGTLPDKLCNPADLRAFYRLMDCKDVTHQVVMQAHADATRCVMAEVAAEHPGTTFLILHDATELDYTTLKSLEEQLGQIGQGTNRGYICHNSLVVQAEPQQVIGLVSQILHHRADVPDDESDKERRERADRESRLWIQGVMQCGEAPAHTRCVDISDSLSDTFEYMAYEASEHRQFVLRAREDRKLKIPIEGQSYLFHAVRQQAAVATGEVKVQPTDKQVGRTAQIDLSFAAVRMAAPRKRSGEYRQRFLDVWAIRVWEPQPPRGAEALEWILLTNVPVTNADDVQERVDWYEHRPLVEEFHKGMKTGCGIETLQFTTVERLEPAIAILSVVATTLLRLRDAARQPDADTRPATDVVASEYVAMLGDYYGSRCGRQPTVKKFYLLVARLGGHQNRKRDGMPGWITLWRGWMKLEQLVIGYRLGRRAQARRHKRCGKT